MTEGGKSCFLYEHRYDFPDVLYFYDSVGLGHIHHFVYPDYVVRSVDGPASELYYRSDVRFY